MAAFLDPTIAYLLLFIGIIAGAIGTGVFIGGAGLGTTTLIIVLAIIGFLFGMYAAGSGEDWLFVLVVTTGFAGILTYFLDVQPEFGIAAYVFGYIVGMRTERRSEFRTEHSWR